MTLEKMNLISDIKNTKTAYSINYHFKLISDRDNV